jgi:serine/threonine protein kinase
MAEAKQCPNCGGEMPANAPQGLCPVCLLAEGVGSDETSPPPSDETSPAEPDATDTFHPREGPAGGKPGAEPDERVRIFGAYELIRERGRGGMGVVYQARQIRLNRPVALKVLKAEVLPTEEELRRF